MLKQAESRSLARTDTERGCVFQRLAEPRESPSGRPQAFFQQAAGKRCTNQPVTAVILGRAGVPQHWAGCARPNGFIYRLPGGIQCNATVMSLDIEQREREGITILDLNGRITVGPEATSLRQKIQELATSKNNSVILNLADVDYIDSTGLGALVVCATMLRKSGGNVKLVNLNRRNIELLVMTKLATIFEIFSDEQDAVNSFFPDRKVNTFDILSFVKQMKDE